MSQIPIPHISKYLYRRLQCTFTECPTDMLTSSDSIFYFLKPHISKSKTCFETLVKKAFRWHLETKQNQIESIFKSNLKKEIFQ